MATASPLKEVLSDAWLTARRRPGLIAAAVLVPTAAYGVFEWQLRADRALAAGALFSLVVLYLQLLVTASALEQFDMVPPRYDSRRPTLGRYPAALGLSILYSVGVLAGLIALIVPGLVLAVRWAVAIPVLLGEDEGVVRSLRRSWLLTRRQWALIVQAYLLLLLWFVLCGLSAWLWYPEYGAASPPAAFVVEFMLSLGQVALWLLSAALYRRFRRQELLADPPAV